MAAKKRNTRKAPKQPQPAQQPTGAGEQPGEVPTSPADAALTESKPQESRPPVAGIGASAGGLDAFKKFFAAMPADSGIGFVVIPHLDPKHESMMAELLTRYTAMLVVEAKDGMQVEANHVYIIPPNKYMTIADGFLQLSGPVQRGGPPTSIDLFLRSLAEDAQEKAICIILSGTGAHGALGLKAIKAAGGLAMVQDPETAEYPLMPRSAIATGLADYVLPVEQMPEALIKYVQHYYVNGGAEEPEPPDHLNQVLALLRVRTRLDFRYYRKKMLTRRIERRMSLSHFNALSDYLAFLREHPDELKQLAKDLLISVTSFFRDPEAWQALETEVIAPLVRDKEAEGSLRVWSAGCATGEEAYSLGMLVLDQVAAAHKDCQVHIFATDIDEASLEVARHAIYPDSISSDVSPERLGRYFTRVNDSSYQVGKHLRETVTFARQNLITDAPFSKLDLIVCRNLLIYLEPEVQRKVVSLLHFALLEGGFLFLGSSETIGPHTDLFESVSKKWRIYRRIGPSRPERLEFPIASAEEALPQPRRPAARPARRLNFADLTHRLLLDKFAPATVLVSRKYEILFVFGAADRYLAISPGVPTPDLMLMAREGLRNRLRSAIHKAVRENGPVQLTDVHVKRNGTSYPVRVDIEPVHNPDVPDGLLLITFQDAGPELPLPQQPVEVVPEESLVRQLENELKATKEDLQSTIEELESSNEELKASNEEVVSMNEELQSANEELETSKEELQSLNEELTTVNSQLHDKVEELEKASNDMTNLLHCTDIATVFLDTDFRIKRFTPVATKLFNLIDSDIGRPIADITSQFTDADLPGDARKVLQNLLPSEKEVATADGSWFRRIMPYRTHDNRIEGVVLTFNDVTALRRTDAALRAQLASEAAALTRLHQASSRLWRTQDLHEGLNEMLAATIELLNADKGNVQLLDATRGVLLIATQRGFEQPFLDYFREVSVQEHSACGRALRTGTQIIVEDVETDESYAPLWPIASVADYRAVVSTPLLGRGGRPLGMISTHFRSPHRPSEQDLRRLDLYARRAADFIERCRTEETLRATDEQLRQLNESLERQVAERTLDLQEREARLQAILDSTGDAIITIDHQGVIQSVNPGAERMFGYAAAELVGQSVTMLMPSPYREAHDGYLARYLQTGEKHIIGLNRETVARRKDGTIFPADLAVSEIPQLKLFTGIHRDLTDRKRLEREVVEAASLEQRRIGQDLHDSVAQELTALNLVAGDLIELLQTGPAQASQLAEQLVQGLKRSQQELRTVLRGLLPVAVDSEGLMAALTELAARTRQEGKVTCTFDCPEPVSVVDNVTATHLYLIAQEAVHNALKHGKPRNIRITLMSDHLLILHVQYDGIGMAAQRKNNGLGLRILRNRAAIIGATLTIEPAEPTGTLVTCTVREKGR
jgi:two-component system CheB/CheR fusion protein